MVHDYKTARSWRTKDGRLLKASQMETGHLINALNMVARHARRVYVEMYRDLSDQALGALGYASGAPDGAAMAAEGEAAELQGKANQYLKLAYDDHACRAFAISHIPIARLMEDEVMSRLAKGMPYGVRPDHR